MKKVFAVLAALLMILCVSACDGGNKPSQTAAAATTADPDSVEVPDFSGLTRIQIEMKYPKLNITFDEKYDDKAEEDEFISQSPAPGTKIRKTDEITVEISLGGKQVEVDDYVGRNYDDVKTLIEKQGLVPEMVYDDSETVTRNCVISTIPSARTMVDKGSTVICYVSLGSAVQEIHMPDFVGMSIEEATKLATDNNIMFSIVYDDTSSEEAGTVISQGIDPDTVVEPNTRVEITIAGENASASRSATITLTINNKTEGEFELKYYCDGTLIPEKTEIKELSLTRKIEWEVSGTDVHTYSIIVTSLTTGKSGKLYEYEVDFTKNPPVKDHHGTFNGNVFTELLSQ
ncbi:MAG: PASTA domain-containing protein [Ruminiclostridium sp.]|nr:PASTA domain-containing protein [Ruminiclostridium sp.]